MSITVHRVYQRKDGWFLPWPLSVQLVQSPLGFRQDPRSRNPRALVPESNDVMKRSHGAYDDTPDEIGTRPLETLFVWYDLVCVDSD